MKSNSAWHFASEPVHTHRVSPARLPPASSWWDRAADAVTYIAGAGRLDGEPDLVAVDADRSALAHGGEAVGLGDDHVALRVPVATLRSMPSIGRPS